MSRLASLSVAGLALVFATHAGNAFLLGELLRARADGLAVSPRVHELLLRRWQGLTPVARNLIGAAAVLARRPRR